MTCTSVEVEMSAADARALTDRIKVAVEATWELIRQAYVSRAWVALGYAGWDEYCTREFGTSRIRIPREERREVVSSMREIGMSTRAIAAATGQSQSTVVRELASGESNGSPPPGATVDDQPDVPAQRVIGTDGKSYVYERATCAKCGREYSWPSLVNGVCLACHRAENPPPSGKKAVRRATQCGAEWVAHVDKPAPISKQARNLDIDPKPREYIAQVGEPSCPPYRTRADMKQAIAEWATAGSELIKKLTLDEKTIMQEVIFDILKELDQ